jgi:hypothetical protein
MSRARARIMSIACLAALASTVGALPSAQASPGPEAPPSPSSLLGGRACPPAGAALSYSDALDKLVYDGAEVGGLSSMAWDARSLSWVSAVDNHGTDPARIWFYRNLNDPTVTRDPLVLRNPGGVPYDGTTSDNEGLAVLPDGDFLVSSETEPSIRIYGRDGIQEAELPVPARFAVTGTTPAGQATSNATLEGLTISPSGREIVAAMEGALSGDTDPNLHRFLVYTQDRSGAWSLSKQIAYRTEPGQRVPEVAAYSDSSLMVEEASFSAATGNAVSLYAVTGLRSAPDVSAIADLATAPAADIVSKSLVVDVAACPSLGAPAKETQSNSLLDNFEGLAISSPVIFGFARISLISDDNFSATQTTRILNLGVRLP